MRMRPAHFLTAAKRIVTLAFFLGFVTLSAIGQCDCPAIDACAPCTGGLLSMSLRFNGSTAGNVSVSDQNGVVFGATVNPGASFTFQGSIPNEKFVGNTLTVSLNASPNATISTLCNSTVAIGDTFGLFTLVAASSKNGGPICCVAPVLETLSPVITGCPLDIVQDLISTECNAVVTWIEPTATDNCSLKSLVGTHSPGDPFDVGNTEVSYVATDIYGNTSTCQFTVTIQDTTAPVLSNCPSNISLSATEGCTLVVNWVEPMASDNCTTLLTRTHEPGDAFPIGQTTVTYTATDPSGNMAECSFLVTVVTRAPEVSGCTNDLLVRANENGTAAVVWEEPEASTPCGDVVVTRSHSPGDQFSIGTTKVTYQFTDDRGETVECTFDVVVLEPSLSIVIPKVITPDGNGVNDSWILENIDKYNDNKVTIFDRWGNTVFIANGYDNQQVVWLGANDKGTLVPTGTYFYSVEVRLPNETVVQKGFVELVR